MEPTGRVVWQLILAVMVLSVPVGLIVRQVRISRDERTARRGLHELLNPPGLRIPAEHRGPRVVPDHPCFGKRTRQLRNEMYE